MPTPTKGKRFGGSPSHQRLILANLAQSLFEHGSITTTEAKAKRLRPYAESLITKAKNDTVANRRQVAKKIRDKEVLHILFAEIAPQYESRPGGYTRIVKLPARKGDNAPLALIELVEEKTFEAGASKTTEEPVAEAPVEEPVADEAEGASDAEAPVEDAVDAEAPVEDADAPEVEDDVTTEGDDESVLDAESPAADEASAEDGEDKGEDK